VTVPASVVEVLWQFLLLFPRFLTGDMLDGATTVSVTVATLVDEYSVTTSVTDSYEVDVSTCVEAVVLRVTMMSVYETISVVVEMCACPGRVLFS
jgi:hypothetical protein